MQQGRGGGGKNGGRRPTCLQGCWPDDGKAAKEEGRLAGQGHGVQVRHGVCQGLAQVIRAEGAALCATPREADKRGRQT
ncbi:hypothetical protein [Xenorhabdus miraniensis]|uniref:hypothetical protein n=1 Tax=Xenorhabdus miraniensis TaxID=351674 RepID=UPI0011AB2E66|nr:hypothetical protein [Xenorhabdus miraniensis]